MIKKKVDNKDNKKNITENNAYYNKTKEEILNEFKVSENNGIKSSELRERFEKYGKNTIEIKKNVSFLSIFFDQATSFLNLLLLFLVVFAFVVWYFTHKEEHLVDSIIIFLIFLFNTIIGAYENYSSQKVAETLKKMLKNETTVLRDGKKIKIDAEELVPGDIIFLEGGDKVPADCYILESDDLKVDESILTGESISVHKEAGVLKGLVHISERKNLIFMNTFVVSGEVKAIVVKTGKNTEMGKIASKIQSKKKKLSFLKEIDVASKKISYFAIILIVFVSIILYLKGLNIITIFLVGSALIIGSIPEGLPAIVISLLSHSVHKLFKKKVLVKEIGLLETLGSIDVLCTDKTGTLTENKMHVKKIYLDDKILTDLKNVNEEIKKKFSEIVSIATEAKIVEGKLVGEPEDTSLIKFLEQNGIDWIKVKKDKKIKNFEPFSSEKKYMYAELEDGTLLKKGAPEILLNNCKYIFKNGKKVKLSDEEKKNLETKFINFTDDALRLIGFTFKEKNDDGEIFLGFSGLYDKPKDGVKETIETLYNAHVEVKMITGDNINTAKAIAKECGFRNVKAIEWKEIINLSDEEFKKAVEEYNVFARMTPDFKEKILTALQNNGHRAAITGDGVNDSIALKQADVGVVMGSGSDIAKESGDLILLNNDFNSIPLAINEGRGIFHNIKKVVNYLLTANLAEVLTIFLSSFFGIVPFTAIQILWVNFVTDVLPSFSLGLDKYPKDIMTKPPTGKNEKIISLRIILLTVFVSIKKVLVVMILFFYAYFFYLHKDIRLFNIPKSVGALIFAQTVAFTWLVFTHFVRIAAIRFDEGVPFFSNKYVNWSLFVVVLIQFIIIYTPVGKFFRVVKLNLYWLGVIAFAIIVEIILVKFITMFVDWLIKKYGEVEYY